MGHKLLAVGVAINPAANQAIVSSQEVWASGETDKEILLQAQTFHDTMAREIKPSYAIIQTILLIRQGTDGTGFPEVLFELQGNVHYLTRSL